MTKEIGRDALKIGFPFIAVMALVLGTALPVLADNSPKAVASLRPVQGEVISVASDNSTFVVQNRSQQQVTITVDANTKYFMAPNDKAVAADNGLARYRVAEKTANKGQSKKLQVTKQLEAGVIASCGNGSGKEAQFSDIQVGDRVIVWVKTADNLATKVLIIEAPVMPKVKGTITDVSDNSITINPASGTAVTLSWDASTRFMLKGLISVQTGQYAAAVYNRNTMTAQTVDVQATAPTGEVAPVT
jgi:Domain of unknown function (DUF5666)